MSIIALRALRIELYILWAQSNCCLHAPPQARVCHPTIQPPDQKKGANALKLGSKLPLIVCKAKFRFATVAAVH